MEGGGFVRRTADDVFEDFKGRRAGLIKALTTDEQEFYQQCDPDKDNLCLFGFPNKNWEVNPPAEEVPPELPEPALGINFARDRMQEKDWLSQVAVQSDSWLLQVSFYYGARFEFDKNDRKRLFNMMNKLPTIYEVVTGTGGKVVFKIVTRLKMSKLPDTRMKKIYLRRRRMKKISERFCCSNKRALV